VLIAYDHALIGKALCQLLADQGLRLSDEQLTLGMVEAQSLDAVIEALAAAAVQLLLIELWMPAMAGPPASEPCAMRIRRRKSSSSPARKIAGRCWTAS
jgi:hypothetical protein